jgi:hypothetical protein
MKERVDGGDTGTSVGGGDVDVDLIDHLLSLTPAERIRRQLEALELVKALRLAGRKHHGFDTGSPPETR